MAPKAKLEKLNDELEQRLVERTRALADRIEELRTEIDGRKRVEEALRASESNFRMLAEKSLQGIAIFQGKKMIYANPAHCEIQGYTQEELVAMSLPELMALVHPLDRPIADERARRRLAGEAVDPSVELRVVRKDGSVRWMHSFNNPIEFDRQPAILATSIDVTENREIAERLRHSQKMEAIGQLAGGVAHDFNNILAVVMMHCGMLRAAPDLPPGARAGLEQIHAAAERAANLTRQLLLFGSKQVMQTRRLDLNEVVADVAQMLRHIIGEDVELQVVLHPTPLITRADAGMVDQVLMNLAINARDAMPDGGRLLIETTALTVDQDFIRLDADTAPGEYVGVIVHDSGPGIPAEILPRIFEPFFTTKDLGKGSGLGLATVFGIVKQHGGFLKVENEPGHGAKFCVFLPASQGAPETPGETAYPSGRYEGSECILLVEDEDGVRQPIRLALEQQGYRVIEAANGVEALERWDRHRREIDLLVTDLVMPARVSGRELAARVRQDRPEVGVVFISGYSTDVAGRRIELQPGEEFLQKPFLPDTLLRIVRQNLDRPKVAQP